MIEDFTFLIWHCASGIEHLASGIEHLASSILNAIERLLDNKKSGPEAAFFSSVVNVNLYLGVDPLFEDELLVLLELITVLQALVLVLAHQLAA